MVYRDRVPFLVRVFSCYTSIFLYIYLSNVPFLGFFWVLCFSVLVFVIPVDRLKHSLLYYRALLE